MAEHERKMCPHGKVIMSCRCINAADHTEIIPCPTPTAHRLVPVFPGWSSDGLTKIPSDEPFPIEDLRPAYQALQDAVNANLETLQKTTWLFGGRLHSHIWEVVCTPDCPVYQPPTLKLRPGDQPLPVKNDALDVQSQVIADIEERRQLGISRYGTALQPNNGRDALRDAYEEAIDLAMYLKQAILERDNPWQGMVACPNHPSGPTMTCPICRDMNQV